jgi:hypothetical protein
MKRLVALVGLLVSGCIGERLPTRQNVVENAALCSPDDAQVAEALLRPEAIANVSPLYVAYSSHGSVSARLVGTVIELRDFTNLTRGRLENVIACHRQALARGAVAPPNDPYAGEARVTVEQGARGSFLVKLSSPSMETAHATLESASAMIGRPSPVAAR